MYSCHATCCILLKFYIKPQRFRRCKNCFSVVSYWNSTSNHNNPMTRPAMSVLYLIEILHQTTTSTQSENEKKGVVSYWNSTSNHNSAAIVFINPCVVSYWNSTSNHNDETREFYGPDVVSYWNSTSNHNSSQTPLVLRIVVSYWNSTSNHNLLRESVNCWRLYLIEILHQTTTPCGFFLLTRSCILLKFYIKPQLRVFFRYCRHGCILLKFYIKPQLLTKSGRLRCCCILLKFYIKPQLSPIR